MLSCALRPLLQTGIGPGHVNQTIDKVNPAGLHQLAHSLPRNLAVSGVSGLGEELHYGCLILLSSEDEGVHKPLHRSASKLLFSRLCTAKRPLRITSSFQGAKQALPYLCHRDVSRPLRNNSFSCRFTQITVLRLLTTERIMGADTKSMSLAWTCGRGAIEIA